MPNKHTNYQIFPIKITTSNYRCSLKCVKMFHFFKHEFRNTIESSEPMNQSETIKKYLHLTKIKQKIFSCDK